MSKEQEKLNEKEEFAPEDESQNFGDEQNSARDNSEKKSGSEKHENNSDDQDSDVKKTDDKKSNEEERDDRNKTGEETSDDERNSDENIDDEDEPEEQSKPNWILRIVLVVVGILLIGLILVFGIVPRVRRDRETKKEAEQRENALPVVNFVKPKSAPESSELVLPGTTQAVLETAINARASGYLTHLYADIGDRVRAGQLLAEIATPEIDEQLRQAQQQVSQAEQQVAAAKQDVAQTREQVNQARAGLKTANAQLNQARTNQNLADVTSRRSMTLAQKGLVSQQEADQNRAGLEARQADTEVAVAKVGDAQANIGAAQAVVNNKLATVEAQQANVRALNANVRRVQELQNFRRIIAPFSGIITARNIDVGGLISSGGAGSSGSTNGTDNTANNSSGGSSSSASSSGSSSASSTSGALVGGGSTGGLFRIAKLDTMRAYVNVPQTYAASIQPGLPTLVDIKELPQREFHGRVSRTSNSLDPNSRTLLAEVFISNESGQLLPGLYAQIKFAVPHLRPTVLIPSSALIARPNGTSVIIINPNDSTIHYRQVEVGRDYGKQIEILDGLDENTPVVTNPTESMQENTKVDAREAPPENENQQQQGSNQPGSQQNQQSSQQNNQSGSQQPNSGDSQNGGK